MKNLTIRQQEYVKKIREWAIRDRIDFVDRHSHMLDTPEGEEVQTELERIKAIKTEDASFEDIRLWCYYASLWQRGLLLATPTEKLDIVKELNRIEKIRRKAATLLGDTPIHHKYEL